MSEYHVIPSLHYNFLDDLKAVFFSLSPHELHPHVKVKILWSLPQSPPVMVHCAFKKCLILVLQPGMEPVSLQWKHRVLTTGPPGNSQHPLLCVWYDGWSLLYVYMCQELFVFFLNDRIITLQYCDGSCHTSVLIGQRYTYVPSLLKTPPTSLPIPLL